MASCAVRSEVVGGFAGSGGALGPQRPRLREQEALAETHVVVEQVDHRALALDPLGDQIDAEAAEQVGQVGGVNVGAPRPASDRAAARPAP